MPSPPGCLLDAEPDAARLLAVKRPGRCPSLQILDTTSSHSAEIQESDEAPFFRRTLELTGSDECRASTTSQPRRLRAAGLFAVVVVCTAGAACFGAKNWLVRSQLRGTAEKVESHEASDPSISKKASAESAGMSGLGRDFCGGIEHNVEYHTRKHLYVVKNIQSAEECCAQCDGDPQCGAWTWRRNYGWDGLNHACFLKQLENDEEPVKVSRPIREGVASGLHRLKKHGIVAEMLENLQEEKRRAANRSPIGEAKLATMNETCRGNLFVKGYGNLSVVNAQWKLPNVRATLVDVPKNNWEIVPHISGRAYLADSCSVERNGMYSNTDFAALKLLGKTIRYTTDLAGVGCGCDAKLHLVPMRQNPKESNCHDYFCGSSNLCGISCAEVGLQDSNQYAWSSTLHVHDDKPGVSMGYGGGSGWSDRRDWSDSEYGPGAECIDTTWPFQVAVSFPVDEDGQLHAMEVTLTQDGHFCPLKARVDKYSFHGRNGMKELTEVLKAGVTPFISYVSSPYMKWMDGVGVDGRGPCVKDTPQACPSSVRFYDFSINDTDSSAKPVANAQASPMDVAFAGIHEHLLKEAVAKRSKALADAQKLEFISDSPAQDCDNCEVNSLESILNFTDDEESGLNWTQDKDASFPEAKGGNPEWEVSANVVNVSKFKNSEADVIGVKLRGQVLHGKREGDWIKLRYEKGYVAIFGSDQAYLQERIVTYMKVTTGSCEEAGMAPITDARSCNTAGFALSYFDKGVNVYNGNASRPEGCYLYHGQLYLATGRENRGKGAIGDRVPICASKAYATTTTTTTSTSTTTTSTTWGTPSLFCFCVMRLEGYELPLVKEQVKHGAGIFTCDQYGVFTQDGVKDIGRVKEIGTMVTTQHFQFAPVGRSDDGFAANAQLFINVWDAVKKDGRWEELDWTVKADPDAVVLPWRIRTHLKQATGYKNYLVNCNAFPSDPMYPMIYGAFEAFSQQSMKAYYTGLPKCTAWLGWQSWGEDKFMGECMKLLGVQQFQDFGILGDKRCTGANCADGYSGAYHDFKSISEWFMCWGQATR